MDETAWGYRPNQRLGETLWEECKQYGTWYVVGQGSFPYGSADWALIVRWLTPEKAVERWGPITDIERGPSDGFKSVTYGKVETSLSWLRPTPEMEQEFENRNPNTYEWVVTVWVRLKSEEPHGGSWLFMTPTEMRNLSSWVATLADVHERMLADGWVARDGTNFERTEPTEDGYTRDRLKAALKGLNVKTGQLRRERRRIKP